MKAKGIDARAWFYGTSFNGPRTEGRVTLPDNGPNRAGFDLACKCGRVLYWEDIGKDYRAVCCGQVYFEHKGRQQ